MARLTRKASFSDDDLEIISSQAANMFLHTADAPLSQRPPLRPSLDSNEVIDLSNSPEQTAAPTHRSLKSVGVGRPDGQQFGKPGKLMSSLKQKAANASSHLFYQPKNRPEHHRDQHAPARKPNEATSTNKPQLFSSLNPETYLPAPPYTQSSYYKAPESKAAFGAETFYTDPAKANEDLKALLEGGMDDEEDEEAVKTNLDDGTIEGIKVKLLPHQVEGVKWMKGRELGPVKRGRVPKGGILADDMGLGKTLQSISLIISNTRPDRDDPGWKKSLNGVQKGTLVVAPLALIKQWEAEIRDKVSKSQRLSVCVHHGPNRTKRFQDLTRYDVVITTYNILVSEYGHCSDTLKAGCFGVHWYRVILDEAHSIKNRNAKSTKACYALDAEYRWCLTGTPMQNNLDELQSLVKFLRITPYDDFAHWRDNIDRPMKAGNGHIALGRLHALLQSFMKRRTKDILKEEGALLPGGKKALDEAKDGGTAAPTSAFKITERKVVPVATKFSPAERRFYGKLEERTDRSIEAMMKHKVSYANALVLLLRLRQACNHPRLVESKLDKDKDALSTGTARQKNPDTSVDDLTIAFETMGMEAKRCDICLRDLPQDVSARGDIHCNDCSADMFEIYTEGMGSKKHKKHKKVSKNAMKEVEPEQRRPRKRNVVMDSDDEEVEGSWLVDEKDRGALHLGKAGGTDDENAEGEGESVGVDDSVHPSEEEGSRLDSFIVDDEDASQQPEADSDDDGLVSIDKISSQMIRAKKPQKPVRRVIDSDEESDVDSDGDEDSSEDDSGVSESEFDRSGILRAPNSMLQRQRTLGSSSKIREIIKILHTEAAEHKFIVFSQFTSMLDLVEPYLRKEGFRFVRYDGQMKNDAREESLHRLRNDKRTRILLCSLKCGSLGLNLTAATRVIIIEPFWNPFVEEQAIDRVHRLTQTVDVVIYKLTVENTVEERILELQDKKRLLALHAIEGGSKKNKEAMNLNLQDLLNLFKPRHDDGQFGDSGVVRSDMNEMMQGLVDLTRKRPVERREDPVYGRRW
ncbi:unnamed protein product [Discula destructiva]